jgi:hypothetical protein
MFLEFWKRQQAVIVWQFDSKGVKKAEATLPSFEKSVHTYRKNPVTGYVVTVTRLEIISVRVSEKTI